MFEIQQRIPNFIEHRPDDLETALIESLEDIRHLEFIKFRENECKEMIYLTPIAEDDWAIELKWNWYIFSTPADNFDDRIWIGWMREIKSLDDISAKEYNELQGRITAWKNRYAETNTL